jgi:hypothetical protein
MVPKLWNENKITSGSLMKPDSYFKVFEISGTCGFLILKCSKKPGGCQIKSNTCPISIDTYRL